MLKRFTFWLWVAAVFMLITAAVHSLSLFIVATPSNDTERQLIDLLDNTRLDMGAGIFRTPAELFKALSSCFSLLCLLGGLINIYLARKRVDAGVVKGLVGIQALVFGLCFGIMAVLTFLPPIILTGLIFVSLAVTFFVTPSES